MNVLLAGKRGVFQCCCEQVIGNLCRAGSACVLACRVFDRPATHR